MPVPQLSSTSTESPSTITAEEILAREQEQQAQLILLEERHRLLLENLLGPSPAVPSPTPPVPAVQHDDPMQLDQPATAPIIPALRSLPTSSIQPATLNTGLATSSRAIILQVIDSLTQILSTADHGTPLSDAIVTAEATVSAIIAPDLPPLQSQPAELGEQGPPVTTATDDVPARMIDDDTSDVDSDEDPSEAETEAEPVPERPRQEEDSSHPDEEELKQIEDAGLHSALDDEYWQKKAFTSAELNDPEYKPMDTGVIDFVLEGFRGTKEKPRGDGSDEYQVYSDYKKIGDHEWRILVYPNGNDTEDQISIYVDCRPAETESTEGTPAVATVVSESRSTLVGTVPAPAAGSSEAEPETDDPMQIDHPGDAAAQSEEDVKKWSIPAQVGIVLYNPAEPTVTRWQDGHKRFCPEATDYGWTRFSGPRSGFITRQRLEKAALCRDDRLAIRAHIRIIKDDTGALWHSGKWDNLQMTGTKGFGQEHRGRSQVMSTIALLGHLPAFRSLVNKMDTMREQTAYSSHRPLFETLQRMLYRLDLAKDTEANVSLRPLDEVHQKYGIDPSEYNDVVSYMQTVRHILEDEVQPRSIQETKDTQLENLFDGTLAAVDAKGKPTGAADVIIGPGRAPSYLLPLNNKFESVQKVLIETMASGTQWSGHHQKAVAIRDAPKILQLEIDRQEWDEKVKRWKKDVRRLRINEELTVPGVADYDSGKRSYYKYTLYGIVTHRYDLVQGSYRPIFRPGGPGTSWITNYASSNGNRVEKLTRRDAIESYDGVKEGRKPRGQERVAQMLMYIRTDALDDVLCRGDSNKMTPCPEKIRNSVDDQIRNAVDPMYGSIRSEGNGLVHVMVWCSAIFNTHTGPGVFDAEAMDAETEKNIKNLCKVFALDGQATLRDLYTVVKQEMVANPLTTEVTMWIMEESQTGYMHISHLITGKGECRLDVMAKRYPRLILWLEPRPMSELRPVDLKDLNFLSSDLILDPTMIREEPASDEPEKLEWSLRNESKPTYSCALPMAGISSSARSSLIGSTRSRSDSDKENDEVRETDPSMTVPGEPSSSDRPELYFFLKTFDPKTLAWEALRIVNVLRQAVIAEVMKEVVPCRKISAPEADESHSKTFVDEKALVNGDFLIYDESATATTQYRIVDHNMTFADAGLKDGAVLCFQAALSESQKEAIWRDGEPRDLKEYDEDMSREMNCAMGWEPNSHPDVPTDVVHKKVIGWGTYIGPLKHGSLHGNEGKRHFMNGDIFTGPFIRGSPNGLQAKMEYSNGDVYTGPMAAGKPDSWPFPHTMDIDEKASETVMVDDSDAKQAKDKAKEEASAAADTSPPPSPTADKKPEPSEPADALPTDVPMKEPEPDPSAPPQIRNAGRMLYATSGNVYEGQFKAGRRHGKGVMRFEEAAGEELCSICLDAEKDGVFTPCGHLVCCWSCGGCLEECPVCRADVGSCVRVFRT